MRYMLAVEFIWKRDWCGAQRISCIYNLSLFINSIIWYFIFFLSWKIRLSFGIFAKTKLSHTFATMMDFSVRTEPVRLSLLLKLYARLKYIKHHILGTYIMQLPISFCGGGRKGRVLVPLTVYSRLFVSLAIAS